MKKNLKNYVNKFIIIFLTITFLSYNIGYTDYSSLTPEEKRRVTTAFKQSKYYKYYEDLAKGKDKVNIINFRRKFQRVTKGQIVTVYAVKIELLINDEKFIRETEWQAESEIIYSESKWDFLNDKAWKIILPFVVGLLVGGYVKYKIDN